MINGKIEVRDVISAAIENPHGDRLRLSEQQWKVVHRMLGCHTLNMGAHVYRCENCHHVRTVYNSCRDRHCPSCQSVARAAWVEDRLDELLPVGHFHVVFTIPQQINPVALNNKSVVYNILFEAVSETLNTLGKDPRWHGGTIGYICVLHTWGQNLMDHPHVHCIIPGGGIREDGKKWKAFRNNYLFPVKVMSQLFRRLFMQKLDAAFSQKKLRLVGRLEEYHDDISWNAFVGNMKKREWVVYAKQPFASARRVVKYIGNYTHRIAIANSRLIRMDDTHVSFRYKDYRCESEAKVMKLTNVEFVRRFLLHVLPKAFVRIRYYGFLANQNRQRNIALCMKMLGKKYRPRINKRSAQQIIKRTAGVDISRCKYCKKGSYRLVMSFGKRHRTKYFTHTAGPPIREATLRS